MKSNCCFFKYCKEYLTTQHCAEMQQELIHAVFFRKAAQNGCFLSKRLYSNASAVVSIPCKSSSTPKHDAAKLNSSESVIYSSFCCVANSDISKYSYLLKQNAFLNEAKVPVIDSITGSFPSNIFYVTSNATEI